PAAVANAVATTVAGPNRVASGGPNGNGSGPVGNQHVLRRSNYVTREAQEIVGAPRHGAAQEWCGNVPGVEPCPAHRKPAAPLATHGSAMRVAHRVHLQHVAALVHERLLAKLQVSPLAIQQVAAWRQGVVHRLAPEVHYVGAGVRE